MAARIGMVQRRIIDYMRDSPDNKITPVKLSISNLGGFRNWLPGRCRMVLGRMRDSGVCNEIERDVFQLNKEYL